MKKKAQVTIEFLLLIAMAFAIVITFLIAILSVSASSTKTKSYYDMEDLGGSLQQEFLLAAELEDGYTRKINLPLTLNGIRYNATVGETNHTYGYLVLGFDNAELFYLIPYVDGNITLGNNILTKNNGTLRIN